jgi:hypothetical protein
MPDLDEPHLHQLTVDEIFKHLGTREGDLSPEEAQQRGSSQTARCASIED